MLCQLGSGSALLLLVFYSAACQERRSTPSTIVQSVDRVRICSQNLQRFTERNRHWSKQKQLEQRRALLSRMKQAKCDVVALQEIAGGDQVAALHVAQDLAEGLSSERGVPFRVVVGDSRDRYIRNGFLYRIDIFSLEEVYDLSYAALPRLQAMRGATGFFSRGPIVLRLAMQDRNSSRPELLLATMHFKSMAGGYKDPTGTKYEIIRMEMAEGLRREMSRLSRETDTTVLPIVLGDRNAAADSASASVLEGRYQLPDFRSGKCRLGRQQRPICKKQGKDPTFVGVFALQRAAVGGKFGSHLYRGKESLLDEVLLRPEDLSYIAGYRKKGYGEQGYKGLKIGLEGAFYQGSDHKLLWVELDFAS